MRSVRRHLTALLASALVIQPTLVLTLVTCCLPAAEDAATTGAACPMHHAPGDVCPHTGTPHGAPGAAHEGTAAEEKGAEDCRLVCGDLHETASLHEGQGGVLPDPVLVVQADRLRAVVRIGDRAARELWSPPLSPPPRA